ncbi:hypothetical protein [Natrarchaeobaculum aegyptiacum]|uniref:hypothetical protein n=1 Tax=Natrarchaeobaculum aegyptiacum TaxID=745377 RepID=UPI0012602014|nr:hypothetical protein [Natrarchaeobaculum aegyptiacum]
MSREEAVHLRDHLASSDVTLKTIPRGFGNERGVPDSVIWIEPTEISAPRMFPILIELEGCLSNVDDFRKFARRSSKDEPYQHHLDLVSLETTTNELELSTTYDIAAVGHRLLTNSSTSGLTESEFHDAIRNWVQENESSFHTSARITLLHETRIVWWQLSFSMYGHQFKTQIPFIVDVGDRFSETFPLYASRIVIPAVAVTTDENPHKKSTARHPTSVHFRRVPNVAGF